MATSKENQEALLRALLKTNNFNGVNITSTWDDLLEILQNENDEGFLDQYFARQADFRSNTIMEEIESLADLKQEAWNAIATSDNNFWNESVAAAITDFVKYFKDRTDEDKLYDGSIWTFNNIKNADAGFKFDVSPWVEPWLNIDKQSYTDVRAGDEIVQEVLNNDNELQFTHSKGKKWIRLLMPKYPRHVEVEDLDRNFWVIG